MATDQKSINAIKALSPVIGEEAVEELTRLRQAASDAEDELIAAEARQQQGHDIVNFDQIAERAQDTRRAYFNRQTMLMTIPNSLKDLQAITDFALITLSESLASCWTTVTRFTSSFGKYGEKEALFAMSVDVPTAMSTAGVLERIMVKARSLKYLTSSELEKIESDCLHGIVMSEYAEICSLNLYAEIWMTKNNITTYATSRHMSQSQFDALDKVLVNHANNLLKLARSVGGSVYPDGQNILSRMETDSSAMSIDRPGMERSAFLRASTAVREWRILPKSEVNTPIDEDRVFRIVFHESILQRMQYLASKLNPTPWYQKPFAWSIGILVGTVGLMAYNRRKD